jgi:pyruvate formate lyase activating enzyme
MELYIFQKGFNFSQDGPGNRLVYHLQGCNLRCPWCTNPEGLAKTGGTACLIDDLLNEALRSRMIFIDGGGVTLTGGEVTLQLDAAKELLARLKQAQIHTAIETNGLSSRLPELFPVVDYLMMDCKHYDSDRHAAVTGHPCQSVFYNIRAAIIAGKTLALRIPLIGGFNASEVDARGFADLFDSLGVQNHATVELIRYHDYCRDKYQNLDMEYTMTDEAKVSDETFLVIQDLLQNRGYTLVCS